SGVAHHGEKWVAWSGEPQAPKPGEQRRFGTTVSRKPNGWEINGTKVFATSATGANWAILLVDTAGPGGARNSGPAEGVLMLAWSRARHLVEHVALETVHNCVRACGARSLVRPSPVERIQRDLTFYVRHDNDDHILATIGRAALGQPYDASFYKP